MARKVDFNSAIVDDRGQLAVYLGSLEKGRQRNKIKSPTRPVIGNYMLVDDYGRVWSPNGYTQVVRNV